MVCSPQNQFLKFSRNQSSFPGIVSNTNFYAWTRNHAQRGLVDAKISTEISVPLQQQRRPRFKIGSLGLRGGAISALAVDQVYSGGPETPIRARKGSVLARYLRCKGLLLLKHWGGSYWKLTSQACAVERFRLWPSIKCIQAVRKHQSARGKGQD